MKKIISLATMVVLAISISVCAFAASSPEGDVIPDKFHINGVVVTEDGDAVSNAVVDFSDELTFDTDSKGTFKAENIKEGKYTFKVIKDSKVIGEVVFTIEKGDKTSVSKLDDGSYYISAAETVKTLAIKFVVKDDGKIEITEVKPAGSDSPTSPPSGDISVYFGLVMLVLSLAGITTSVYFRRKYSM